MKSSELSSINVADRSAIMAFSYCSRSEQRQTPSNSPLARGRTASVFDIRYSAALMVLMLVCGAVDQVAAQEQTGTDSQSAFQQKVVPFFREYCVHCHGPETKEAELRLDTLAADFLSRPAADHWVEVLDRINLGEMPPDDEPKPDAKTLTTVTDWITAQLQTARRQADSTSGRVLLRRLTRREYANTVRDLLHVDFVDGESPLEMLPPDGSIQGFDKISKALLLDPSLMEAYFTVAKHVADRAVRPRPPLVPEKTLRFDFKNTTNSAMSYLLDRRACYLEDGMMVVMESSARTFSKLLHPFNGREIPITGRYRVRVRAAADPGRSGKPVYMDVTKGSLGRVARFRVDATKAAPKIHEFTQTFDAAIPGEWQVGLVNGTRFHGNVQESLTEHNRANKLFADGNAKESMRIRSRMRAQGDYDHYVRGNYLPEVLKTDGLPKLYLDWIEVIGPLQGEFPPPSMKTIFFKGWGKEHQSLDYAREIFRRLLPRAFRRHATDAEVEAIVSLVQEELASGMKFEEAIKSGIVAMLCSPDFLYLFEPEPAGDKPRKLNDFELATRLSYFLWSSKPDDALFLSASQRRLSDPSELAKQVDRLLADPRSEGFVQGFARQWLKIDEFDRFPPDQDIFPQFYATEFAGLSDDLKRQPLVMFREILRTDASLLNLLDSDWTMVNERLAAYYGLKNVQGEQFRRVPLPSRSDWEQWMQARAATKIELGAWHTIGPFAAESFQDAFDRTFGPEDDAAMQADYPDGIAWTRQELSDGKEHYPWRARNAAVYLSRSLESSQAADLTLRFGIDDGSKVWLNGKLILEDRDNRGLTIDDHQVKARLRPGTNRLLIKVVNADGGSGFWFDTDLLPEPVRIAMNTETNKRTPEQRALVDNQFCRTSPSGTRGGLLGMGGVHMWGSDGSRTKPVERGKYVLDVLFNDPPPPPPPNAGEVEPNIRGENLTVRERLRKHREQTTCANCHRRIDPYGLALDNFNVIGQWRDKQDGEKRPSQWRDRKILDTSGVLPNGRAYAGYLEFKQAIKDQHDRYIRGLAEKMTAYALGRTIEPTDRPTIDQLVSQTASEDYSLHALIRAVVATDDFQSK